MSKIKIKSFQRSIDTGEAIRDEYIREGKFNLVGDTVYISYEDVDAENGNKTFNRIKVKDNEVTRTVKGDLDSTMIFAKGRETTTNYITPFGVISLRILTKYISITDSEDYCITLEYILSLDGKPHSDNEMVIQVKK